MADRKLDYICSLMVGIKTFTAMKEIGIPAFFSSVRKSTSTSS